MSPIRLSLALALACVPASARSLGPTDPQELEAFLAGLLPALMETHHVPGAVFVMVKDGEVFFQQGYGFADLDARRTIDPETTRFRVASISKLFAATAAMQLVERGALDLHADVNTYLTGFQIEPAYGEPVTLARLLTHTGGFDDRFLRSSRRLGAALPPLGRYLAERMPPRVEPPDVVMSYSNHGYALIGHLVERASGMPFEAYVREHLFEPLGMERSRFGLTHPVSEDVAVPYEWKEGRQVPLGFDHTLLGPAAELNTTASDMARFLIAHLQLGRFEDRRILREDTARLMQATHFTQHPKLDGWCYGFQETHLNGVRTVGHGGDWRGFRSALVLVPEANLGLFVSVNGAFQGPFYETFAQVLADRYLPAPEPSRPEPPAGFAERSGRYTGTYVPNRRIRASLLKLGQFLMHLRVAADGGTLRLEVPNGDAMQLVEVEPDLFQEVDGNLRVAFLADEHGRIARLAAGPFVFDKLPWHRSPRVHGVVLFLAVALFVGTLLGWGLGALARLLPGAPASPLAVTPRLVASAVCALDAVFVIGVAWRLTTVDLFDLFVEVPAEIVLLLVLPLVSIPLTLSLPWWGRRAFAPGRPAPLARLHWWVLTGTAWLLLPVAWYWNLIGFRI